MLFVSSCSLCTAVTDTGTLCSQYRVECLQVRLDRLSCASSSSNHSSSHSLAQTRSTKRKGMGLQQRKAPQWGTGTSPMLTPIRSGRYHPQQQQVLQQQHSGLLQRLLPLLCVAAPSVMDAGSVWVQQQPPAGQDWQQVSSFGSSSGNNSSGIVSSRSGWQLLSWRKRPVSMSAARMHCEEPTTARVIARCDTFQVYFKGQYQPLEQQLAMVERELATYVQSQEDRTHNDAAAQSDIVADRRYQGYRRQSLGSGSSSSGPVYRRTSSDISISSLGYLSGTHAASVSSIA
eukprot:GHUV01007406.1.p1 GENE.GHUV01007406.1~~GHUV01007406.1.p1  ORF type:complete len:289 (+),score=69.67 GHUV01007406.1:2068-2934(+)